MTYRTPIDRCHVCTAAPVLGRCLRCQGALCFAHLHAKNQRCERCELDWTAPLRGMRVLGPKATAALVVALMTALFITGSAASVNFWSPEIERIKWVGGAVVLGLMGLLTLSQLLPAMRFDRTRRRFLRERLPAPGPRNATPDPELEETAFGLWRRPSSDAGERPRVVS